MEEIIKDIEGFCKANNIDHRFVGGVSFGGLLNKHTTWIINIKKRTITLHRNNSLSLLREDKTIKDIDLIIFSEKQKEKLQTFVQKIAKTYKQFPCISVESPIENVQKKNTWLQFVSALETDEKNNLYFSFEDIKQQISWKSFEPWTVILDNKTSFSVRNPVGDYIGYLIRTPSGIKPKDQKKLVYLERLSNAVVRKGKEVHIDYFSEEYFLTWKKFAENIQQSNNLSILIKKYLTAIYWHTVGTFFSRTFANLGNQFTGVKQ